MMHDCFRDSNDNVEVIVIKKNELLSDRDIYEQAVNLIQEFS